MIIEEHLQLDHVRGWAGQKVLLHAHFLSRDGSAFIWLGEEHQLQGDHFDAMAMALNAERPGAKSAQLTSLRLLGEDVDDASEKLARLLGLFSRSADWIVSLKGKASQTMAQSTVARVAAAQCPYRPQTLCGCIPNSLSSPTTRIGNTK